MLFLKKRNHLISGEIRIIVHVCCAAFKCCVAMCHLVSEVRRSDLEGEPEAAGRVSAPGGAAVAADGAGGAAGKSAAAKTTNRYEKK